MAVTATVRRRIDDERVSVSVANYDCPQSIRSYDFALSLRTKVQRGDQVELAGEVTRIDGETVTIDLGPLVTVEIDMVRLIERYRGARR
ncbi:hypothetical protein ACFSOZ_10315 [Mesorhizobium newzealandense]|uniref:Uncharacterized protein n=1 Tax=Mesorhizobium newzealandense TaxID=1300302 RepID=A0ABW4UA84_9HYPH